MTDQPLLVGVELGGTKCVCILASGPDDIRAEVRTPTESPEATLNTLSEAIRGWRSAHTIGAVGIASFGPLDLARSVITSTPKPGWSGVDLAAWAASLGLPSAVDTDVNGAAVAESLWGAAAGRRSCAYVTLGTGVGVGLVFEGRRFPGPHAEAGHMRVPRATGDHWGGCCPFHGDCVEGLASGPAVAARTGQQAAGLAAADPVWPLVAHAVAGMLHNLVLTVWPERIVIGGGVAAGQPHLLPRIETMLRDSLAGYADAAALEPGFVMAPGLGPRSGSLGAIALARGLLASRENPPSEARL